MKQVLRPHATLALLLRMPAWPQLGEHLGSWGALPSVLPSSAPELHWNRRQTWFLNTGLLCSHSMEGLQGVRGEGPSSYLTTESSWCLSTTAADSSLHRQHQLLIIIPPLDYQRRPSITPPTPLITHHHLPTSTCWFAN